MPEHDLTFHPEALAEVERARDWYQERNPSAARAFLRELEHGISRIAESPTHGPDTLAVQAGIYLSAFHSVWSIEFRDARSKSLQRPIISDGRDIGLIGASSNTTLQRTRGARHAPCKARRALVGTRAAELRRYA
jgi:plasmid stabilization system protein ParE